MKLIILIAQELQPLPGASGFRILLYELADYFNGCRVIPDIYVTLNELLPSTGRRWVQFSQELEHWHHFLGETPRAAQTRSEPR